jgi:hypothetical protein
MRTGSALVFGGAQVDWHGDLLGGASSSTGLEQGTGSTGTGAASGPAASRVYRNPTVGVAAPARAGGPAPGTIPLTPAGASD